MPDHSHLLSMFHTLHFTALTKNNLHYMHVSVTGLNPACGIDVWVKKSTLESFWIFRKGGHKDKYNWVNYNQTIISRGEETVALTISCFASSPVHAGCMHFSRSITDTWGHFLRPSRSTNLLLRVEVPTPQVTEHSDHGPQGVVVQIPSLPSRSS